MENQYGNFVIQKALKLSSDNIESHVILSHKLMLGIPLLKDKKLSRKWAQILNIKPYSSGI